MPIPIITQPVCPHFTNFHSFLRPVYPPPSDFGNSKARWWGATAYTLIVCRSFDVNYMTWSLTFNMFFYFAISSSLFGSSRWMKNFCDLSNFCRDPFSRYKFWKKSTKYYQFIIILDEKYKNIDTNKYYASIFSFRIAFWHERDWKKIAWNELDHFSEPSSNEKIKFCEVLTALIVFNFLRQEEKLISSFRK